MYFYHQQQTKKPVNSNFTAFLQHKYKSMTKSQKQTIKLYLCNKIHELSKHTPKGGVLVDVSIHKKDFLANKQPFVLSKAKYSPVYIAYNPVKNNVRVVQITAPKTPCFFCALSALNKTRHALNADFLCDDCVC